MRYIAGVLIVVAAVGFVALGVAWVRAMQSLHKPFRIHRTRGKRPPSDDEIRAYRKFQRDTSWLGPGSVPPDPPNVPES
jgi:hypothetical protein